MAVQSQPVQSQPVQSQATGPLDGIGSVLAVVAHPDDESFGLGGVLARVTTTGAAAAALCFTHGEASTLHGIEGDLGTLRSAEFAAATRMLRIGHAELLAYPDSALGQVPLATLAGHVTRLARQVRPSHLLAFDLSGVTGHPDHQHATAAALAAADGLGIPVLMWALPAPIAGALNEEFGASFAGRPPADLTRVGVDRTRQREAIACHASQSMDNPVLHRRLELLGHDDYLVLRPAAGRR